MLYCSFCAHGFTDGTTLRFKVLGGTEIPYHAECFAKWADLERAAAMLADEEFDLSRIESFERPYRDSQVMWGNTNNHRGLAVS